MRQFHPKMPLKHSTLKTHLPWFCFFISASAPFLALAWFANMPRHPVTSKKMDSHYSNICQQKNKLYKNNKCNKQRVNLKFMNLTLRFDKKVICFWFKRISTVGILSFLMFQTSVFGPNWWKVASSGWQANSHFPIHSDRSLNPGRPGGD